jgi:hypothetical protein
VTLNHAPFKAARAILFHIYVVGNHAAERPVLACTRSLTISSRVGSACASVVALKKICLRRHQLLRWIYLRICRGAQKICLRRAVCKTEVVCGFPHLLFLSASTALRNKFLRLFRQRKSITRLQ